MSDSAYTVSVHEKPIVWLKCEVKTPPVSSEARVEAGYLLRLLQQGRQVVMPHSRPMATIGARCHELRISDASSALRIYYRVDPDAIIIAGVHLKTTRKTPQSVLEACRRRLRLYDKEGTDG
jgi:phage-related protein